MAEENASEESQSLKQKTARGLAWGLVQNGATQVLNLVFGIVLLRQLSTADYGLAGEVAIFSSIATALQESGFISALTNRRGATREDYNSVFWFNVTVSVSLYVLLWCCAPLLVKFFGEPELLWLSRYAFLGFVCASFAIAPRAMLFKQMKVRQQSLIALAALAVSGMVGIGMAYGGCSYWSLVTQTIVYVLLVSTLSWHVSGFRPMWKFSMRPIREMFGFSVKILATNIFNSLYNSLFTFVFGRFYGKVEVGVYTTASRWNGMGSLLITGMVHGVAQPMFVAVGDDMERLRRVFRKMARFTVFLAYPALMGLGLVAPEFIVTVAGEKWLPSAYLMQMLCLAGAFMPLTNLYTNLIISHGRSDVYLWNIVGQSVSVLAMVCCVRLFGWSLPLPFGLPALDGLHLMVLCYVVIYLVWMLVWHYFLWRAIRLPLKTVVKDLSPIFFSTLVVMGVTGWMTRGIEQEWLLLLVRVVVAAVLYVGVMWIVERDILKECLNYVTKRHGK